MSLQRTLSTLRFQLFRGLLGRTKPCRRPKDRAFSPEPSGSEAATVVAVDRYVQLFWIRRSNFVSHIYIYMLPPPGYPRFFVVIHAFCGCEPIRSFTGRGDP